MLSVTPTTPKRCHPVLRTWPLSSETAMRVVMMTIMMMEAHAHLSDGARHLRPHALDLLVQRLEGKRLQRPVGLGQEAHHAGGRREAHHGVDSCRGGLVVL